MKLGYCVWIMAGTSGASTNSQYPTFETIEEAQSQATELPWIYNNDQPNMDIGGITPAMKLKMAA